MSLSWANHAIGRDQSSWFHFYESQRITVNGTIFFSLELVESLFAILLARSLYWTVTSMFSHLFEPPDAELYEDECIKWTKVKKRCLNQLVYRLKWFDLCLFSQYKDICSRNSMTICSSLFRLVLAITALLDVLICAKMV